MGSRPATSSDPADATFSYLLDNQLWGPFCYNCMNRWMETFASKPEIGIYMHCMSSGKSCKLEELRELNGKEMPFTFRTLDQEVRKYPCFYEKCRFKPPTPAPSPQTVSEPDSQPSKVEASKFITRPIPRSNPSYVAEKRPVEFPILHGTSYKFCKAVTLEQWQNKSKDSMEVYNRIAPHKQEVREAFDALNWKTINCDVCETVDPEEPYVEHVLSEKHYRNLCRAKRWLTLQHFDVLDGYCRQQEAAIKSGKRITEQKSALQQYPLLAMWNSPYTSQMPRKEFDEKLDNLSNLLKMADHRKLNEKNPLGIKSEVCFWCGTWVSSMSSILEHILSRQHRDYLFEKTPVSVKEINSYINMVNQAKRLSPSRVETPTPRNPPPRSSSTQSLSDSNLIRLPFLTGHENPPHPMTRDQIVSLANVAKDIIKDTPKMKGAINDSLLEKGRCLQSCAPCNKKFPAAVSVLEHSVSIAHIEITGRRLQFSRLYDYLPLVVVFLDALKIPHPTIGVDNIEEYFAKIKKPTEKKVAPPEVTAPKYAEVKISKLEQPPTCPFLSPRSAPRQKLTEEECLNFTKPLRAIICENEKIRKGIMANTALTNIKCFVCNKVFNSPFQTWEHVVSAKHISQVYSENTSFCYVEDYLEAVRTLYSTLGKAIQVSADNVANIVSKMETKAVMPKSKNMPVKAEPTARAAGPSLPLPSRSSSSTSISSAPDQKIQGCKMISNGRCLRFMNVDSKDTSVLTDEQLFTVCRAVKAEICGISRCYVSEYDRLGPICPTDCPVCEYRALGCCDFVVHLFEDLHYNKLVEAKVKVSASDVQFWIEQLMALRRGSFKMAPPVEDAVSTCWAAIGMSIADVQAPSITSLNPSHYL